MEGLKTKLGFGKIGLDSVVVVDGSIESCRYHYQ